MARVSETGGRHQRSFSGLLGALLVTVLVIIGFVTFREVTRDNVALAPEPVEYLSAVRYAQEQEFRVAYPAELPEGWFVRDVELQTGRSPVWDLDILTDETRYVGVHQEAGTVDDVVARLVDEQAVPGDPVRLPGAAVEEWSTFTDEGGDYAVVAQLRGRGNGGQVLIVFGSAGAQPIRDLAASLTFDDR